MRHRYVAGIFATPLKSPLIPLVVVISGENLLARRRISSRIPSIFRLSGGSESRRNGRGWEAGGGRQAAVRGWESKENLG